MASIRNGPAGLLGVAEAVREAAEAAHQARDARVGLGGRRGQRWLRPCRVRKHFISGLKLLPISVRFSVYHAAAARARHANSEGLGDPGQRVDRDGLLVVASIGDGEDALLVGGVKDE